MDIRPLSNKILIQPVEEEKMTKSGIVLPETASKEKPMMGTIVAVGPGKMEDGKVSPMSVKVGDKILYKKYGPDEIEIDGKKYLIGDEDDVLAVVK